MNRMVALMTLFLACVSLNVSAQVGVAREMIGTWTLEDAYTIHLDDPENIWIESHAEGLFTIDLIVYGDGTGVLGDSGFAWGLDGDAVVWRLPSRTVRILPRPLDDDTILILALAERDARAGSAVSIMRRAD